MEDKDKAELYEQRQNLRNFHTQQAHQKLQEAYGERYSVFTMMEAEQDVENLLERVERGLIPAEQYHHRAFDRRAWER